MLIQTVNVGDVFVLTEKDKLAGWHAHHSGGDDLKSDFDYITSTVLTIVGLAYDEINGGSNEAACLLSNGTLRWLQIRELSYPDPEFCFKIS